MPISRLTIGIAEDGLSATLAVTAGPALSATDLETAILNSGIVTGVSDATKSLLSEALLDPNYVCTGEVLARGRTPEPASDPRFEPAFSEGLQAGHLREDGSLDYHDRELLKPVHVGDRLGTIHAAVTGCDGQCVDGRVLSVAKPRPLTLSLQSGVTVDSDGQVRAARDGVIFYKAGQLLDVVDRHEHRGSVDLHSGDLNMQGSLVVRGDVTHPFAVSATGDLEIVGSVDSASVLAGGDLRVRGGVRGCDGGSICAAGSMRLHHVESAELYCGGQLQVQEAVNSELTARELHVERRLRGGSATAETEVMVNEAGAASGITTRLVAGEPLELPVVEARRAIAAAKAERAALRRGGRNDARAKGGKLGRTRAALSADELLRAAERAKQRQALLDTASIRVTLAHEGVEIAIGDARVTLDQPVRRARYRFDRELGCLRCDRSDP
jgi:uncharacterized protein (DUF342 family)